MEKPKPHTYYDYWQVIRYLKEKNNLSNSIEDDFFRFLSDKYNFHQDSLISLYIKEYAPHSGDNECEDDYCLYHSTDEKNS